VAAATGFWGTGLGLYICRALVRELRDRIWVSSEAGKASTFFVEIRVASKARGRRKPGPKTAAAS